jgi:hypothetical protein
MTRTHLHWAEKLTVQFAAAAGLAMVYFLAGPALRGVDPQSATAFLATGRYVEAAVLAVMVLVLSAACALLTLPSRPEGALLAALIAAGGISARSPQFRTLLWRQSDGLGGLYAGLIAEVVVLTAVLLAAYAVISLVRRVMAGAWSGIVWKPSQPAQGGPPGGRQQRRTDKKPDHPAKSLGGMGLALAMGMALVLVFLQSGDRGQVIFALVAGLALAVMAADRLCPVSHSGYFLLMPMAAAVLFYLLGWVSSAGASAGNWTAVPLYARVLPIDWLTAGCGGASLGYWISQRATESRQFE